MDFLSGREKDPLYAKYSTFPGWQSSHIYQRSPSEANYLQYLSKYGEPNTRTAFGTRTGYLGDKQTEASLTARVPSQSKLYHRELYDYTDGVRNLAPVKKQRSDTRCYKERDIYAHCEGWESTWPTNRRGKTEHVGTNSHQELQAYANRYHHTLPKKTPAFEAGDWSSRCTSDIENLLGCEQWAVKAHKKDLSNRDREHWSKWSPWDSRNMESIFPVESFRQPPSYTAPPAYSFQKDGNKLGIPNVSAQALKTLDAFPEQTFEKRYSTDFTETQYNASANNGQYLHKNNQPWNTESYYNNTTGGQNREALKAASVMRYTTTKTQHSQQTKPQYPESTQMIYPDVVQMKQTKPARRKGGETVFCLVSRMGEVSGLSSSPEEPLKSHVLPLLTDFKPNGMPITTAQTTLPQSSDDSRQNQDAYLKRDETEKQLLECCMSREDGNTLHEHREEDQQFSYIQDLSKAINKDENKQDLQWNDSQSGCLDQTSCMQTDTHEKPCREIIKFPLWKEPKYQSHSTGNEQTQGIINESSMDSNEYNNNSTNDQQQSLVVIDATCVVVKVEFVLLPEKEHVQYVCLTEESPFSSTSEGKDKQKQHSSVLLTHETPENNTVDERAERKPDEHHREVESDPEELDSSCESHIMDSIKKFEGSPVVDEIVEALDNELMSGQLGSGTNPENNDSSEAMLNVMKVEEKNTAEPEVVLEDFMVLTNSKPTLEAIEDAIETNTTHMKKTKEQVNRPILDHSDCVDSEKEQDDETHQKDTLNDLNKNELTDQTDDREEPVFFCSATFFRKSTEYSKEIQDAHKVILPLTVCSNTLRRSSSSPHLFTSRSSVLDMPVVSQTEDEPQLLPTSANADDIQCSGSPNVRSSCTSLLPSPSSTPILDMLKNSFLPPTKGIVCTSPPSEHKLKMQHAKSLWDAVSRIRKHTAPDSETEDEEVDECGDQPLGVICICKHTAPDSETENEELGECGDQTKGLRHINKFTASDLETENEELGECRDQSEGLSCICKHTAHDFEMENEELGECGDQNEDVRHIQKHTAHDSKTEDEDLYDCGDQSECVSLICKHTAQDSETKEEELGECGDQNEDIHKHTVPEAEEVNESGDHTEDVWHTHIASDSETEEAEVNESEDQPEGVSFINQNIHLKTAPDFETEDEEVNESGDDSETEEEEVNESGNDLETEEEEVNDPEDQPEGVNNICKHSAPDFESDKEDVNKSEGQPEDICFINKNKHLITSPDSETEDDEVFESLDQTEDDSDTEEEEVNESQKKTEDVSFINKNIHLTTAPDSKTQDEEVNECGDQNEDDSETEEQDINESEDQSVDVGFIHINVHHTTVPDSETVDEEVNVSGDQTEGVNHICKQTAPDFETEEVIEYVN